MLAVSDGRNGQIGELTCRRLSIRTAFRLVGRLNRQLALGITDEWSASQSQCI